MRQRSWYTIAGAGVLAAVAFAGCTAWESRELPPVLDAAGVAQEQAMQSSLPEQFALVAQRYRAFNEIVTETQLGVHQGEWIASGPMGNFMTMGGDGLSSALAGQADGDNSYYLDAFWRLDNVDAPEAKLEAAQARWESEGWVTSKDESDVTPGAFRVTATAEDGTWLALSMMRGSISLTAYSGVYWGDREALAAAIWNIMQNERNEGIGWRPERVNAEGYGLIRPGEYAPYPAWHDIAYAERLEESPLWAE